MRVCTPSACLSSFTCLRFCVPARARRAPIQQPEISGDYIWSSKDVPRAGNGAEAAPAAVNSAL